ncbi:protein NUCLEAR FUSION DEFECTIVE 4 isoform X2 [Spinacia oleracea]|uniref:Protein NUCLEAR FUSION DEFECTIVE 4 isoform X2 n=1 Tax=Spinacia oleracea TaxID=3562 RepID=A0A9R0IVT8_SPIOL|nr:protein NUCLEAR FUSION DEFECTIVE 4-like isoform X2 [Spinacia oleracea]
MRPRNSKDSPISSSSSPYSYTPKNPPPPPPPPSKKRRKQQQQPLFSLIKLTLSLSMAGQSRKWVILVATIWLQAFTGTNFDFSAYSSEMKALLGISQVQLNYLAVASDLGKAFGWSSGLALMYLPLWSVMFIASFMGLFGYGLQWFVLRGLFSPPYFVVFFLCLLSGCSICWFNTVCFVLCIKNFPANRALALSLTVSFNGVSAALYTLAANSINPSSNPLYLLLNALIPLLTSFAALIPILRQPELDPLPSVAVQRDSLIFFFLNFLAVCTGFYLLFLTSSTNDMISSRFLFGGATFLLFLPLCIPGIVYARDWFKEVHSNFQIDGPGFILVDHDDLELHKEMSTRGGDYALDAMSLLGNRNANGDRSTKSILNGKNDVCCGTVIKKDQLVMLGEEHSASELVCRVDFWLYYIAYFCGGTIGLVYSNNLGQIAQSLGQSSSTSSLITLYSSFSFFGRLLSATPDYIRAKFYFARTGWLAIALIPTPIAFFLLTGSGTALTLQTGTALIGLSSGFIFAAAVSITSELFGPSSVGVNHNILITNIPIGSLVYGLLAAVVYDSHAGNSTQKISMVTDTVVCMGRHCYFWTFFWWGCLSVVGLFSCLLLFLRTKHAYDRFERDRVSSQLE